MNSDISPTTFSTESQSSVTSPSSPSLDNPAPLEKKPWDSISFGCGGWLQFYLYGVARAIQAHGLDHPDVKYLGCSAGSLAATGIVLDTDFDICMQFCKDECLPAAFRDWLGLFNLHIYCSNVLDIHVLHKYHDIKPGRLQIAITQLPSLTAERATSYTNAQDLKDCLLASCAAFPLARLKYRNGMWCVDGGMTDFQPILDEKTITVSPFYFSNCDIKPSRYVPLWWAVVPPGAEDTIDWLYHLGFEDGLAYFERMGLKPTARARPEMLKFSRRPHPFDVPGRVSLHRVLGYDLSKLTQGYMSYVVDFFLFIFLLLVVKPLMLLCIYGDLIVEVICSFLFFWFMQVYDFIPVFVLSTFLYYPNSFMTVRMSPFTFVSQLFKIGPSYARLRDAWDAVCFMVSPALFRGFLTMPKKFNMEEAKNESLEKLSVLYRVFKHAL